ncbi:MAG: hypothetical protein LBC88_02530 [Spirochaetaceae bacterium]|jgi:hypothetical protein|nr:hypothetical protein [Spirochaetaceae bacterium]
MSNIAPIPYAVRSVRAAGLLLFFMFAAARPAFSAPDGPLSRISDDSALRRSLISTWFNEIPARVLAARPFLHTLPGGDRVEVRTVDQGAEFTIVLAREYNASGDFPGWAQGSFALTRSRATGARVRIRIFPRSDAAVFVQLRPEAGGKSLLDVVVYDAYIVQSRRVPLEFERLLQIPVEEIYRAAGNAFPRRYFEPDVDRYRDVRALVTSVRGGLPGLVFREDGAIDSEGNYVFIKDMRPQPGRGGLNCSGFAKWFVDGLLRPLTGARLSIEPLKAAFGERGSEFTDPWEAIRDPFFGLDWTRNLAARANGALRSAAFGTVEEFEVRAAPFSALITRNSRGIPTGNRSYPGFLLNAGFGIEGIEALLYTLAIDEPGRVYLASVSQEMDPAPRMRQHFHVAVLIPYFDEYGRFTVTVFESAEETSFARFKTRYGAGTCVNLSRIPVEAAFTP